MLGISFFKEINTFIQQESIKLVKTTEDMYNVTRSFY